MLHRVMFGSLERFTGFDRTLCGAFPALARTGAGRGRNHHVRRGRLRARGGGSGATARPAGATDLRNEKINYKVREHSLAKVPVLLVVGKKEAAERAVSIRRLGSDKQSVMPLEAALNALTDEAVPPDVRRTKAAA